MSSHFRNERDSDHVEREKAAKKALPMWLVLVVVGLFAVAGVLHVVQVTQSGVPLKEVIGQGFGKFLVHIIRTA